MKTKLFESYKSLIETLMEEKKFEEARAIANTYVLPTSSVDQKEEMNLVIYPPRKPKSNNPLIRELQVFAEHGDGEAKKNAIKRLNEIAAQEDEQLLVEDEGPSESEQLADALEGAFDLSDEEMDEMLGVAHIETVSWVNNATKGAIDLANEYPDLDYSTLFGKERVTVRDVRAIVEASAE